MGSDGRQHDQTGNCSAKLSFICEVCERRHAVRDGCRIELVIGLRRIPRRIVERHIGLPVLTAMTETDMFDDSPGSISNTVCGVWML